MSGRTIDMIVHGCIAVLAVIGAILTWGPGIAPVLFTIIGVLTVLLLAPETPGMK